MIAPENDSQYLIYLYTGCHFNMKLYLNEKLEGNEKVRKMYLDRPNFIHTNRKQF